MRIITGDECGLLKESIPELSRSSDDGRDTQSSSSTGIFRVEQGAETKMNRTRGIVDLCFSQKQSSAQDEDSDAGSLSFCALRVDGSLEQFAGFAPYRTKEDRICSGTYNMSHTIKNVFESEDNEYSGRPIALCSAHQYQTFSKDEPRNIIACCSSMGLISVVDTNNIEKGVVAQYNAYSKGKANSSTKITYTGGNFVNRDIASAMAMSDDGNKIIVGGRERAATMMDIETGETTWKAKNLPPNPQTLLQQPIWSSAIEFLSKTDTAQIGGSTDLLAIGTAYKQLQIYDIRTDAVQRRPVIYTPEWDSTKENLLDHRVTSLCQLDSKSIVVGDSAGFMHTLDLRKIKNQHGRSTQASVGRFTGPAGSVRQIMKHQSLPVIACVGLDRMLRTYDIRSRKQLDCVYLKQRLNCMLFCSDETWVNEVENEDQDYEIDDDGNIDAEDHIVDYINSSDENMSTNGEDDDDEEESSDESDDSDSDEETPKQKKQRV